MFYGAYVTMHYRLVLSMNFLEFAQQTIPRDERTVKSFARSSSSIFGFIAYGVLYGFMSLMFATCVGMLVTVVLSDFPVRDYAWVRTLLVVLIWGIFAFSWVPFVRWVRRRTDQAQRQLGTKPPKCTCTRPGTP